MNTSALFRLFNLTDNSNHYYSKDIYYIQHMTYTIKSTIRVLFELIDIDFGSLIFDNFKFSRRKRRTMMLWQTVNLVWHQFTLKIVSFSIASNPFPRFVYRSRWVPLGKFSTDETDSHSRSTLYLNCVRIYVELGFFL